MSFTFISNISSGYPLFKEKFFMYALIALGFHDNYGVWYIH